MKEVAPATSERPGAWPTYKEDDAMIVTVKNGEFQIDDEDANFVELARWRILRQRNRSYVNGWHLGERRLVYLHRLLMGEPSCDVDHRNHDGTDNRRENLRLASRVQNSGNSRPYLLKGKHPSGEGRLYKGVSRNGSGWMARIGAKEAPHKYLGTFRSQEEAAHAFDCAALKVYGEFAWLNFPKDAR